jgi:hypothetical protein
MMMIVLHFGQSFLRISGLTWGRKQVLPKPSPCECCWYYSRSVIYYLRVIRALPQAATCRPVIAGGQGSITGQSMPEFMVVKATLGECQLAVLRVFLWRRISNCLNVIVLHGIRYKISAFSCSNFNSFVINLAYMIRTVLFWGCYAASSGNLLPLDAALYRTQAQFSSASRRPKPKVTDKLRDVVTYNLTF